MTTAVDSSVLLDLLSGVPGAVDSAHAALRDWRRRGGLIFCDVVYSEIAASVDEDAGVRSLIESTNLTLVPSSREALELAGLKWKLYVTRRPRALSCPKCGALNQIWCSSCGEPLRVRQHLAPDFIIGAHASIHADRLLTTDRGFYRSYFKDLEVVGY